MAFRILVREEPGAEMRDLVGGDGLPIIVATTEEARAIMEEDAKQNPHRLYTTVPFGEVR